MFIQRKSECMYVLVYYYTKQTTPRLPRILKAVSQMSSTHYCYVPSKERKKINFIIEHFLISASLSGFPTTTTT